MIVLDTNIISELMRSEPAPAVFAWASVQPRAILYSTSISNRVGRNSEAHSASL